MKARWCAVIALLVAPLAIVAYLAILEFVLDAIFTVGRQELIDAQQSD